MYPPSWSLSVLPAALPAMLRYVAVADESVRYVELAVVVLRYAAEASAIAKNVNSAVDVVKNTPGKLPPSLSALSTMPFKFVSYVVLAISPPLMAAALVLTEPSAQTILFTPSIELEDSTA